MPMFKPAPEPAEQGSLRLPATRRIALESSQRLSTITESGHLAPPPVTPRSILRNSTSTGASARTAPPPYEWVSERDGEVPAYLDGDGDPHDPIEGEDVAQLRQKEWMGGKGMRAGWKRLALVAVAFLAVIGLAVGLGVGLTVGRKHNGNSASSGNDTTSGGSSPQPGSGSSENVIQQFPLGEYSFVTALRDQQTDCTANSATWRCYPYSVFNPSDGGTNTSSLATFNWIISNTTSTYPSNATTLNTEMEGVAANLSISSTNNPFAIAFDAQPLTYVSAQGNVTSARYTFSFTLPKVVMPSPSISNDNTASTCFFNGTILSGSIYLAAESTFEPNGSSANTGGYEQWPYAVEIQQRANGGSGVPDCYETTNGLIGQRITSGLAPQSADKTCLCDYRNF